jgi:serine/threonine protein kinase
MDAASKKVMIIDFGFSLQANEETKLTSYCGTPHYMDPDLVKKQPYSGPAADIWAAGVILFIILVGKLPFFGEFEADLYRKIQSGKHTPIPREITNDSLKHLFSNIF